MKKAVRIISAALILVLAVSVTACSEIEGGSKIQRMTMELEFLDSEGAVADTQSVTVKLYLNYAPQTTAHFMELAASGYYDGTVISNVNSTWCEFGGYKMSESGTLEKKEQGQAIEGEFAANGFAVGNPLRPVAGSLILKRNYDTNDGVSQFNSGKGEIVMCLGTVSTFDYEKYCVFGMVVSDDATGTSSAAASASDSAVVRDGLSSLDKIKTIASLQSDENGNKTYYNEKSGEYFRLVNDDEGAAHYYKGLEGDEELLGDELENFNDDLTDNAKDYLVIPYLSVRIKSIKKAN